eukprot:scaffold28730_cov70-Phaeocystis_antarctica.AAC.3
MRALLSGPAGSAGPAGGAGQADGPLERRVAARAPSCRSGRFGTRVWSCCAHAGAADARHCVAHRNLPAWEFEGDGIGDFGRASRPHRSLPLGPERLGDASRMRGAAKRLGGAPNEAGVVSCGASRTAAPSGRAAFDGHCQQAGPA